MSIFRKKMPNFEKLNEGSTAILDLPLGLTYHNLLFRLSATGVGASFLRAHIEKVRALVNGKAFIRDIPAAILHKFNLYNGSEDDAVWFMLDFEEPRSRTIGDQYATCVGTAGGVNSFTIEFDINGTTGDLEIDTWANVSADLRPLGLLPAMYKESAYASRIGRSQIKPGYGASAAHIYRRVALAPELGVGDVVADVLDAVSLVKSGIQVVDRVTAEGQEFYQKHYESVPQAGLMFIDFVEDNNTSTNLMPTEDATSLYWEVDTLAAANIDFYYSVVTTIDKL